MALALLIIAVMGWVDMSSHAMASFKFFYLLPILIAVTRVSLRAGCMAALASMAVRSVGNMVVNPETRTPVFYWNWFTDLLVYLLMVWAVHGMISLYRELDRRVAARTDQLMQAIRDRRQLERELLEIATHERTAIGSEIHDDLCQQLVGTAFEVKVLADDLSVREPDAARRAQAIVTHVEDAIATARRLARGLLDESIPPEELPDALAELAAKCTEGGVHSQFRLEGNPAIPNAESSAQLLRIAQEAVYNAVHHAKPSFVEIVLGGNEETAFLLIKDDGSGMTPPAVRHKGVGLRIMAQRATVIGGILSIRPRAGKGTAVICHLPLKKKSP